jgi:hypothetical protein
MPLLKKTAGGRSSDKNSGRLPFFVAQEPQAQRLQRSAEPPKLAAGDAGFA